MKKIIALLLVFLLVLALAACTDKNEGDGTKAPTGGNDVGNTIGGGNNQTGGNNDGDVIEGPIIDVPTN